MAVSLAVIGCSESREILLSPQATEGSEPSAPLFLAAQGKGVPGSYIVVMKPQQVPAVAAASVGVNPRAVFRNALNGFSAELTDQQLATLRQNPAVHFIEQDQIFSIDQTQVMDGNGDPWGLDRIDQQDPPLSGDYSYNFAGVGVTAYTIDTGIRTGHTQFWRMGVSRAFIGYDAFGGDGRDCNGHGMHVAGIVGAKTYVWTCMPRALPYSPFG